MVLVRWLVVGLLATVVMDVGAALSRLSGLTHGVAPPLMGKWFSLALRGRPFVEDIRTATGAEPSLALGLGGHYVIGAALGLGFGLLVRAVGTFPAPAWLAMSYALGTCVFSYGLMFPGMGFGLFGASGPSEWLLTRTSLVNHLWYGVGLWLATRFVATRIEG